MKLAYYPGCSLHGTAKEYDASTRMVCKELGVDLEEVPDWNCCGASSAHSIDKRLSYLLPARNLKIIEQQNLDVVIPCAACFSRTKICSYQLKNDENIRKDAERQFNYNFKLNTNIYHLLEFFIKNIGLDEIKSRIKHNLKGMRVVCYYGCLLVRPYDITKMDEKENPQFLDELMPLVGAVSLDWPYKTECCGASLSLSRSEIVFDLVGEMVSWAKEAQAQAIVTACPLCQANLEMRQPEKEKFPIFYFTELLAIAFGINQARDCLKEHLIETDRLIKNLNIAL